MGNTSTTRRALLGAAGLAPLAVAAIAAPVPARAIDRSEWLAAVARHDAAWRQLEDHPIHRMLSTDPGYADHEVSEARCCRAVTKAERALFATPAPDHAAVIEKLTLYLRDHGDPNDTGAIESVIADVRRLNGETANG